VHRYKDEERIIVYARLAAFVAAGVFTATFLATNLATAAAPPLADPQSVGFSPQRLQRLGAAMQGLIEKGERSGIVTVVSRGGHIVQLGEYGQRDVAGKKPMRADTIVRAYGMTEPVTAVAVMSLYEEGKLQLDDPIVAYIPQLAGLQVLEKGTNGKRIRMPTRQPITIRQLLTHTSGLSYTFPAAVNFKREAVFTPNVTLAELIPQIAKLPLVHQPGAGWTYGPSYEVLARLVEVISQQPFDQFLEQRIFKPLAMNDTGFHVPAEKRDRFAEVYTPSGEKGALTVATKNAPHNGSFEAGAKFLSGSEGLVTTALDYWIFAQMLANRGELDETRILSPSTVSLMLQEQLPRDFGPPEFPGQGSSDALIGHNFGLGFVVLSTPERYGVAGNPGLVRRSGTANTTFWIDPERQVVAVFMSQYLPKSGSRIERDFQALVYQAIVD
jgi:CubicO group peptidase (beta-lactamase class C family)